MSGAEILLEPGVFPRLLQGLWVTVWIAGVSVGLSIPVGLVVGWLMTMKNPVIRVLTRIYLDFIRIMPQLALLFIAFYGFARAWNWNLDATGACVFVFVLWGGAELGDLVRGALESIPKAQYESAYVLGLSGWQTFVTVILPQALRRLLPASVNLATRIVKNDVVGRASRRGRGHQSGSTDHRREPFPIPDRNLVDLRGDFLHVLHRVLAAVHRGPPTGKEVVA